MIRKSPHVALPTPAATPHYKYGEHHVPTSETVHGAAKIPVTIVNTQPEHTAALAKLQRIVFPTLDEGELFTEAKFRKHVELFPEGQFTAIARLHGENIVVGSTSCYRTPFDFNHFQHTYLEAIAHGWLTNHDPQGEWVYGVDMNVHPDFRGLSIGRHLYEARQKMVRRLNLRGEIAGALLPNYHLYHDRLTIAQYVLQVYQGKLHDPTLSMQIRNGFKPRGILYDHISDARSFNCAALIVRENPMYAPAKAPIAAAPVVEVQETVMTDAVANPQIAALNVPVIPVAARPAAPYGQRATSSNPTTPALNSAVLPKTAAKRNIHPRPSRANGTGI